VLYFPASRALPTHLFSVPLYSVASKLTVVRVLNIDGGKQELDEQQHPAT
jgi:hypothetical protein